MMKFLCEQHRQEILEQPGKAQEYWHRWMDEAGSLMEQRQWQRASGFIGCSFEVAEWLLQNPQQLKEAPSLDDSQQLRDLQRYMLTGHQLAECLGRAGHRDMELHFLLTVHLRLMEEVKNRSPQFWMLKQHLQISWAMLGRYRSNYGSFKGYYDCCVETEMAIKQCIH